MLSDTLILLFLSFCLLILITYHFAKLGKKKEGFEGENSLVNDLINQYDTLTEAEKVKLSQIFGVPVHSNELIHKSSIPPQRVCPPCNVDNADYVKRSSIPPCPEPKPCVAPKVVIDGELCKQQSCPPCPQCDEKKVELVRVPVFIMKTVVKNNEGEIIEESIEEVEEQEIAEARRLIDNEATEEEATDEFKDSLKLNNVNSSHRQTDNNLFNTIKNALLG